ncbi:helix-turn-helix domain-containing protein [Oceanirhabdus sp. W0125-5]|uniref:helix-turn-helix domain-containing protein n=1 Tax=Oceanirhabdus sp. W0125-5 TaxID=2999116 RepID=UPI0022F2CA0D|nr:helix-turn-helix domain-containing protein [Oceanirhabdus sp. W0125-5]WBW94985.1 helix-turn-helix domain-containing protein [Oceanirhabdus sp. W0125-5]
MTSIKRIKYRNSMKEDSDFEIVDLQLFFATRPHWHLKRDNRIDFWVIIYITDGEGYHVVDFDRYAYKAGDVIIVQKNQVQNFEINNLAKGYVIHINEPFFFEGEGISSKTFLEFFDRPYKSPILSIDNSVETMNRAIIELIYKEYMKINEESNEDLIRSLFQSFILSLNEFYYKSKQSAETAVFRTYNQFRQLVEANYTEKKTVEDYAQMMLVSKKTINYATRTIVGLSAKQYIINRIILEIKRYLSQGELLIYEISDLLGFDEPANMTKFFKRFEGVSPKAFRKEHSVR